jgi:hypothetical protein
MLPQHISLEATSFLLFSPNTLTRKGEVDRKEIEASQDQIESRSREGLLNQSVANYILSISTHLGKQEEFDYQERQAAIKPTAIPKFRHGNPWGIATPNSMVHLGQTA